MFSKSYFEFVFVILVYKNYEDLIDCLDSIKENVLNYRVVIVNAYFDEESKNRIESISTNNNCDFINIDNRGYSYGNNKGIEFANNNYKYNFLIISNPDVIIKKFDKSILYSSNTFSIFAPKIIAKDGRMQNPASPRRNSFSDKMTYIGFKKNNKFFLFLGLAFSKLCRFLFLLFHKKSKRALKIYAAHGSFVIFRRDAISILFPVYDNNMFLFAEEDVLAFKAHEKDVMTCQINAIEILHKEDGSMKLSNISINNELKKSNIYFYENYIKAKIKKNQ